MGTAQIFKYVDVALQSTFDAIATKDANTMYGVRETNRIYFASDLIADKNVFFSTAIPSTAGIEGVLYVVTAGADKGLYRYNSASTAATPAEKYESLSSFKAFATTSVRDTSTATNDLLPTELAVATALADKVDVQTGYSLMADTDKTKLDNIEAEANKYVHPDIAAAVTAGTSYNKVSFDSKGHVATASAETTLAGLGLTDAYTKTEVDNLFSTFEQGLDWKEAVATFNDIATTYPNPVDGWTVSVKDTNRVYRYDESETAWVDIFGAETNIVVASSGGTGGRNGLMTAAMAEQLAGLVAEGGEPNQNAFSNVVVGATTIAASAETDSITLVEGTNITITPDAANKTVTIAGPNATSQITALTSYAISTTGGALAATDTLNGALGKLEYRIKSQEDALTTVLDSDSTDAQMPSAKAVYDAISVSHI